ncbi:YcxB family protein [Massilia sp. GCM10023247]|uniref:YcxB family protein n=1 Tax=Massilia sp. GCM10023247 TaxID=3252643 RepID=UPI00361660A5
MSSLNDPGPAGNTRPTATMAHQGMDGMNDAYYGAAGKVPRTAPSQAQLALCDLHFFVRYSLREYVGFMWQHGGYLIRRRHIRWPASLYMQLKSTLSAAFRFLMLGRNRRTYEFTIDRHGIVRTSGGVTLIDWADVTAVRTYSRGFMMVLKRGTLPIPFRCLDEAQQGAMRMLAQARRDNVLR